MKRSDMTLQEWLDWRKIGASDAAVIMGCSPFKTLRRLYEERVEGRQVFVSKAMEHGNFCESAILYEIEGAHEAAWGPMEQQVCISSDTHPFLTATLDGWFADEGVVVEVKATQLKAYQAMREADAAVSPVRTFADRGFVFLCVSRGLWITDDGEWGKVAYTG